MSLIIDDDGTMYLYQGDSGEVVVYGLDPEKKYTVYFAIQDKNRKLIGEELQVGVNNSDTVTFILTSEYTDLLEVSKQKPFEIYFYGIKACEDGTSREDTLFVTGNTYGDLNQIIVFPRKVNGALNG